MTHSNARNSVLNSIDFSSLCSFELAFHVLRAQSHTTHCIESETFSYEIAQRTDPRAQHNRAHTTSYQQFSLLTHSISVHLDVQALTAIERTHSLYCADNTNSSFDNSHRCHSSSHRTNSHRHFLLFYRNAMRTL